VTLVLYAAESAHLAVFVPVLLLGLGVALLGHLTRERWLVLTGLLILGGASAYFSFVLQPSG
jgi:hypothetical protein